LKSYCTDCHNAAEAAGNVVFEGVPPVRPAKAKTFEAAIRKLRGGPMPPPGNPRPHQQDIDGFIAWAEHAIDESGRAARAGHVPIQRLNRAQYAATVADLLGVDIDATQYLPTEVEVDGFTNIAAALSVSPTFLDQYIGLARVVAHRAVGEPNPKLASVSFQPPTDDQDAYEDGLPPGTRGGMSFTHTLPADGEYRFTISDLLEGGLYPGRTLETENTLVAARSQRGIPREARRRGRSSPRHHEGARARQDHEAVRGIPVQVPAGPRNVVTFIERGRPGTDEATGFQPYGGFNFRGQMRAAPHQRHRDEGRSIPCAHREPRQDLVCTPETAEQERPCAERITASLAGKRIPPPRDRSDVDRLMPFYEGPAGHGFDAGIEQMIAAVPASPILYARSSRQAGPRRAQDRRICVSATSSSRRACPSLWSQGPDDELLELAAKGSSTTTRRSRSRCAHVADPRAGTLVTNFALKWLNLTSSTRSTRQPPVPWNSADEPRADFATEIDEFVRSGRSSQDARADTADYTFVNERLARHYGITSVQRAAVPARDAGRPGAFRFARQRRRAAAHVVRRPHVARAARRGCSTSSWARRRRRRPRTSSPT
jgi:hypothetical protein